MIAGLYASGTQIKEGYSDGKFGSPFSVSFSFGSVLVGGGESKFTFELQCKAASS